MAITAESDIPKALHDHLLAMSPRWPVAMPSTPFTPPADGKFYRVSFQPNDVETPFTGPDGYTYEGIYLVTVITKDGVGELIAAREASRIVQRIEYLTKLATPSGDLLISKRPSVRGGLVNGGYCEVPVVIRYELHTE